MNDLAFQQLKAQIQSGDDRGMRYVFEQCSRYCIRTLMKKTGCSEADSEDVFMDAILIFRENVLSGRLEKLSNLQTYVFGICWNLWRELRRAQEKWGKAQDEVERQLQLLISMSDVPFQPDETEETRRRIRLVSGALKQLGEKCRQLLEFVYVEQRSQKEIADLMGFASPNVVKVTRHRCYQQWVKHIEQNKTPQNGNA